MARHKRSAYPHDQHANYVSPHGFSKAKAQKLKRHCPHRDPEIMERRYPVVIRQFSLRDGSGGEGKYRGGDGVIRDIEFLSPEIQVSILSERRVYRPYGLKGGEDAKCGLNLWIKQRREEDGDVLQEDEVDGKEGEARDPALQRPRVINLGAKTTAKMGRGDRIIIHTPGGGGWGRREDRGKADENDNDDEESDEKEKGRGAAMSGRAAPVITHGDDGGTGQHVTHRKGSLMEWDGAQLGA